MLLSISRSVSQVGGAVAGMGVETCGGFKEPFSASAAMVNDDFESIVYKCVLGFSYALSYVFSFLLSIDVSQSRQSFVCRRIWV